MANRHYANIGDVWKHLVLAEILSIDAPPTYWESHAGAAQYGLTHSAERDYGVGHFVEHAGRSPALCGCAYRQIIERLNPPGRCTLYPGSPVIAMLLLDERGTDWLFCDLDADGLLTIRDAARALGLAEQRIVVTHGDGIVMLEELLGKVSESDASGVFALIDPYDPWALGGNMRSSAELFGLFARRGVKAMLWYGLDWRDASARTRRQLLQVACSAVEPSRLWWGEVVLAAADRLQGRRIQPLLGCGVLCSNLTDKATAACVGLGQGLASIYAEARLPSGHSGALRFSQAML